MQCFCQVPMPRAAFDDTKGATALESYATPVTKGTVATTQHASRYLCHGAAGALLMYLEQVRQSVVQSDADPHT